MRLDIMLAQQHNISREKAKSLITQGLVSVSGRTVSKPSYIVEETDTISLQAQESQYVSRGGYKLAHALNQFQLDVTGLVCTDIGASTGGFTDCLLQQGAKQVYAIDVGTNQLHPSLQNHPQIVSLENTNIRTKPDIPACQFMVIDVSFISLSLVLPVAHDMLAHGGTCLALVKPQFEVGKKNLNRQGIVKVPNMVGKVVRQLEQQARELGFSVLGQTASPITGKSGNAEFFLALKKEVDVPPQELAHD